ncbi:hypothetical protein C5Y96_25170 [Blastopirellula marina]|uniref:Uncharacterized protein n=1 Tax=Blastopirellula marina TaxID=124 RepID=A0A2S8EZ57_9BACT|nr:hypothetical protein C5Y96_25170 [Blastopirellula marina]RCS41633.1 hypothetical protein DTL36_25220 [Bremerella cremea]
MCFVATALGQQRASLIDPQQKLGGWTFDNGKEFPGAVGHLELKQEEMPTLVLHGDFSKGGMYVQAAKHLPDIPIDTVTFEVNVPRGVEKLTTRLIDGTGQCHQLNIRLGDKGGWQQFTFPVARYFASLEAGAPMDIVTGYEKWSGANDGRWHQPGKLLVFLAGREALKEGNIAIRNVMLLPTAPKVEIAKSIRLDDVGEEGTGTWQYNNGNEFPGAKGSLVIIEGPRSDEHALRLSADFSAGGRYVGVRSSFAQLDVKQSKSIELQVRSDEVKEFSLRLVDSSDQTHQRHGIAMVADGQWHAMTIDPVQIAGGEHWGGANDGKWHGAVKLLEVMLNGRSSESPMMSLDLGDIRMEAIVEGERSRSAWTEGFDGDATGWQTQGDVRIDSQLSLQRSLEKLQQPTLADSSLFPVQQGTWEFAYRWRSKLHSPDNSFHGAVSIKTFDVDGNLLATFPLAIGYGENDWEQVSKLVKLPAKAKTAQWEVQLNKAYGQFAIDDLSAARLVVQPAEPSVESIRIATKTVGNLFYPGDAIEFQVTVPTTKALQPSDRELQWEVRDYQGKVVARPTDVALVAAEGKRQREYQANLSVEASELNVGQFYELHVSVPQGEGNPITEFSGFAILPEAASKQYRPEQIPFTIRNWDSRIGDYFYLADRLGLRMMGVWGGWSNKPPYKPHLPGLDVVKKLDAKWVTGTPCSQVEDEGFKSVTEESLREGMTNFLEAYSDQGLAMIALGNEPHGKGQVVLDNVKAYKTVYEAVKAFDPEIHVIGTSVEPNEEYFQAGYQNYLDSYDFHIYEHYTNVRRTMAEYRELMRKYGAVKPIHSTELGLNSQGQARLAVAVELIKKCTVFFAEGGETVSWFTIMYPDKDGNARGQFGDAHCVFDCKFNNYNPRLDAVAYYHMINSLAVKKFQAEKQHPDGTQEFLFVDDQGECLKVVWNDNGKKIVDLGVAADAKVDVIRIDGLRKRIDANRALVSIEVSGEPVLVLYRQPNKAAK